MFATVTSRTFLLATLLALSTAVFGADARKPNVIFIMADDLGFSDLGSYGAEIETPNLDRLAKDGLRFTQFYNTARCWPSRSVLLSGYYAQQIRRDSIPGIQSGGRGVRPAWARLLPEMLRSQGYRSYHSGKWHVDGKPMENGFDHSFLVENHNDFFSTRGTTEDGQPVPQTPGYYVTTATADHAIKCLREHAEKYPERPFFEYLAFIAPHFPLQAPQEDIAKYRDRFKDGWNVAQAERYKRLLSMRVITHPLPAMEREVGPPYAFPDDMAKLGPGEVNRPIPWTELTSEQREFQATKMAVHAAMIDRMDREIGRVLDQLKAMGALENTLIFFASDNGGSAELMVRGNGHDLKAAPGSSNTFLCLGPGWSSVANTPFRRHKTWVHEGGIATPLVVHWPKGIAAKGELRTTPGHLIDIAPTVLELAGAKPPAEVNGQPVPPAPGKSLVPIFAKDAPLQREELWWAHEENRAIRVGDLKLVAAGENAPWELYDLSTDRGETKNLAAAQPEKVRELGARWTKRWDEFREIAMRDNPPAAGEQRAKRKKGAE
jgi:arylsulfatase A-like enzyme